MIYIDKVSSLFIFLFYSIQKFCNTTRIRKERYRVTIEKASAVINNHREFLKVNCFVHRVLYQVLGSMQIKNTLHISGGYFVFYSTISPRFSVNLLNTSLAIFNSSGRKVASTCFLTFKTSLRYPLVRLRHLST